MEAYSSVKQVLGLKLASTLSELFKTSFVLWPVPGNSKGGSITVALTSCLTGLESAV